MLCGASRCGKNQCGPINCPYPGQGVPPYRSGRSVWPVRHPWTQVHTPTSLKQRVFYLIYNYLTSISCLKYKSRHNFSSKHAHLSPHFKMLNDFWHHSQTWWGKIKNASILIQASGIRYCAWLLLLVLHKICTDTNNWYHVIVCHISLVYALTLVDRWHVMPAIWIYYSVNEGNQQSRLCIVKIPRDMQHVSPMQVTWSDILWYLKQYMWAWSLKMKPSHVRFVSTERCTVHCTSHIVQESKCSLWYLVFVLNACTHFSWALFHMMLLRWHDILNIKWFAIVETHGSSQRDQSWNIPWHFGLLNIKKAMSLLPVLGRTNNRQ